MGIDAGYQALPEDCALLARALDDPALGDVLCFAPYAFLNPADLHGPPARNPAFIALYDLVRDLIDRYPGIETRSYHNYSRDWDRLHFMLSEQRRRGDTGRDDLGTAAIKGAAPIADLCATQGIPLRWNSAATVRLLTAWLNRIGEDELYSHFDIPDMDRMHVYKFHASEEPTTIWHAIWSHFTEFRAFYRSAAEHGEGVLVVLD